MKKPRAQLTQGSTITGCTFIGRQSSEHDAKIIEALANAAKANAEAISAIAKMNSGAGMETAIRIGGEQ